MYTNNDIKVDISGNSSYHIMNIFLYNFKCCFAIIVLQMYCFHKCYVALPHGTMGWLQCVIVVFLDHTH